jgi:hypothetical protein
MRRRFLFALLAYLVPTFALGYAWHLELFADRYDALGIYRPDPIIPFGFLSMLVQGSIFAFAYPRLVARPGAIGSGMRFAALAALLSWSFTTVAVAAKHPITSVPAYLALESAFTALQFLIVGPLLALSARASIAPAHVASPGSSPA